MKRLVALALLAGFLQACSSGGGGHKATPTTVAPSSTLTTPTIPAAPTTTAPRPGEPAAPETLESMSFVDASHGFGLTYPGVVAATTDGGASWVTKSRLPGPPDGHGKIVFLDRADGAALFDGLLVTHDGGTTWATTPITRASDVAAAGTSLWAFVAELCFSDQPDCRGHLEASADAGRTWRRLPSQPPPDRFTALARTGAMEAYLVSSFERPDTSFGYRLSTTVDDGRHWRVRGAPCDQSAEDVAIAALAGGRVWMVCGSQPATIMQLKSLYRSVDRGLHWQLVASTGVEGFPPKVGDIPISGHLSKLFVGSDLQAWMLLGRTGLWTTSDGGRTWQLAFPFEIDGQAGPAAFLGSRYGWAVAVRVVWRTTNGARWTSLGTPSP